jgi:hypothetical protein
MILDHDTMQCERPHRLSASTASPKLVLPDKNRMKLTQERTIYYNVHLPYTAAAHSESKPNKSGKSVHI